MPVVQSCNPGAEAVHLRLTAGHRLRYSVDADPGIDVVLRDHDGGTLLSATAVREWPTHDEEYPPAGNVRHTLGIQFGGTGTLIWTVDLVDQGGIVLRMVKECRYANTGGPDEFIDALRIFVTR